MNSRGILCGLMALLVATVAHGQITLFDRITPTSGPPNSLVNGRIPIAAISVPFEGYAGTIEFSTPDGGVDLSSMRIAYGTLPSANPSSWTLRFMLWSSFDQAIAGLPGNTTNMYNGDVCTWEVPGSQASFSNFGTHFFGGPIYLADINLDPYNLILQGNRSYVLGFTVFGDADVGVMETAQLGAPDRGLSPYYGAPGWRFINSFEGLDVGRYAVALNGTPIPAPGAAGLITVAGLFAARRRRR